MDVAKRACVYSIWMDDGSALETKMIVLYKFCYGVTSDRPW